MAEEDEILVNNIDQVPFGKWKTRGEWPAIVNDYDEKNQSLGGKLITPHGMVYYITWRVDNLKESNGNSSWDLIEQVRGEKEAEYANKLRQEWIDRNNSNQNSKTP